jgi:NAD(P)-dependent dehydrogenase (short-subunit alcohol dehydrogenase family)
VASPSPTKTLTGAYALVTGGGTGIGRGIATALAREGATVTLAARRRETLEDTAAELRGAIGGAEIRTAGCDVTVAEQVKAAVATAAGPDGKLDITVANAGTGVPGPFLLADDNAWRYCCELNIIGTASTFRFAAERMRDHGGGSLIAISTAASAAPEVGMATYTATKAAVDMMVRSAAWELGAFGIRVNSIQPGYVPTGATEGSFPPGLAEDLLRRTALGRSGDPEDIAGLVVHLSSPAGAWITGQVIGVCGGMTVQPMADLSGLSRRMYGDEAVDAALGRPGGQDGV